MTLDIDHLRGWIGREDSAAETVTPELVHRFNATLDRQGDTAPGAVAPLLIHFCLGQPAAPTAGLGEDGHPARGGFLPPVPLPRRMWAGGGFTFHDDIRVGERVTRRSRILDVTVKEGRSGVLCFVTVEHRVDSDGRAVLTERQDIVYRAAETGGAKAPATPPAAAPAGAQSRRITASAPLLFRYSALTFNGHRIHYDTPYAREVEGYPGLIIHGPLQATLLAHLAADTRGARPARFSFRSLSPIFDTADFTINAEPDGDALKLWTARIGGPVAMEARAEW
ncbi:FAS1-like dehydratase domain-containing protein [Ruixingdingia sedimenti]|uniref:MaoC family dehydratase N-terminal domain-containing protein n=1 Tax=Ruixingdingia sedimenti TaxID=3073604 RepID=A0ABU1F5J1_9RHOB|nr:MaoC family dehydratase N-terminal domain-containing protein [Xinfangfangia sp. LG-4]MDR5652132.1 MaoC family dehydratase N-terminal domain-containing protein [Xinfangfangia sp. LG-4]